MALTKKVAVLVGATGQLGPAIARTFANQGARVVLVSPHKEGLDALQKELGFPDTRVLTHVADAMDEGEMQQAAKTVYARFGRADILLHVAGGFRSGSLLDTPGEVWDHVLNMNLRTAVNAIRAFQPLLTTNGWGRILTISSGITQSPPPNVAAYVTAKAALETLTLAVAREVQDKGVTANVVLIRALDTPSERAKQPDKLTGWVKPDDVAAALLYLCSDEAGAITGARIPIFGGA